MKQSIMTATLVGIFFISAVTAVVLSGRYFFSMKELERVRFRYAQITSTRAAMQSLATDCADWSRQNPSLDAVLAEFKPKGKSGAPTNAPANPKASK
jgi:hypothetical protein